MFKNQFCFEITCPKATAHGKLLESIGREHYSQERWILAARSQGEEIAWVSTLQKSADKALDRVRKSKLLESVSSHFREGPKKGRNTVNIVMFTSEISRCPTISNKHWNMLERESQQET